MQITRGDIDFLYLLARRKSEEGQPILAQLFKNEAYILEQEMIIEQDALKILTPADQKMLSDFKIKY